ncbi:hypothetical protein OVA11_17985 [Caulobacter sp. SL161]|uniref:hypothetical protein n=1 Tax=Caulobacter sp. SL161 TaxID=2995156 RepID=UPI002276EC80|nr:hypothetical protein [Caulobacter sp. SL161]MCY1648871.1 hypothetical protein [Caulobacter sp. SL161]
MAKILLVAAYDVSMTDSQALDAPQHGLCAHASRSLIVNALNPRKKLDKSDRRFFAALKALPRLCSTDPGGIWTSAYRYSAPTQG